MQPPRRGGAPPRRHSEASPPPRPRPRPAVLCPAPASARAGVASP